ncbi:L-threonylcarbamoyladenylate synthase [Nitrincola tapanii]|uniref:Threonylcarbamoyl-AMP synthase n=1 Tax=Nitrincola tapanii TaxID=1708751 RepID=A0A5A9W2W5_9GAMM|nr:L-threonylcarbamoyladenylate synthase [Nitrincola tapanii]KAA0873891.1 threonylcarbamoyl-AMP synthase [Nitrincola tapanii]
MSQFFQIHAENPQKRLIAQAVEILRQGGVVAYPTDCAYALGCCLEDKKAMERIKQIRQLDDKHNFTLVCKDLSEIATYAKVDNSVYRLLKAHTPGAYTFILNATSEVPRRLLHPKRRTIGMRVPDNPIVQALLDQLGEPIMSTSLIMPGDELPLTDPYEMRDLLQHHVDLIIDGGFCGMEATTVVNLTGEAPEIVRLGAGDPSIF